MNFSRPFLAFLFSAAAGALHASSVPFFAQHSLTLERPSEIVEVAVSDCLANLPKVPEGQWRIVDENGQVVPFQLWRQAKGNRILFSHTFARGQQSANFTLVADPSATTPPAKPPVLLPSGNARELVVETALAAFRFREAGVSPAGGVDILFKKVPELLPAAVRFDLENGYRPRDDAGRLQVFAGAPGVGGSGLWVEGRFVPCEGFRSVRVLASGAVRTLVEVMMAPVSVGEGQVFETKYLTLNRGLPFVLVESRYRLQGVNEVDAAFGLATLPVDGEDPAQVEKDAARGRLLVWQGGAKAAFATGIEMIDTERPALVSSGSSHYFTRKVRNGTSIRYVLGAAMPSQDEASSLAAWSAFWTAQSTRRTNAITIAFRNFAPPPDF